METSRQTRDKKYASEGDGLVAKSSPLELDYCWNIWIDWIITSFYL